jgi:FAD/FMN-containing dehydrogenase
MLHNACTCIHKFKRSSFAALQVAQLVLCASAANLRFAVRGGGHSYEAMSLINRALVIDLQRMDSMQLVPGSNAATCSSATVGEDAASVAI